MAGFLFSLGGNGDEPSFDKIVWNDFGQPQAGPQGGVGPMDGTNNPSLPAQSANSRYAAHPVPHPPGHRLRRCSIWHPAFAVDKSSGIILDSRRLVPQRGVAPMDGTNHPNLAAKDANRFLGTSCASPFEPRASAYCHRHTAIDSTLKCILGRHARTRCRLLCLQGNA